MTTHIELVASEFSPTNNIYLLNHSVGRMPSSAKQAAADSYFETWHEKTADTWPNWLQGIDQFRAALASLFNAETEEFCPQTNVSSGLTKVLGSLNSSPSKNIIVYTENDFPSVGFVLQQAQRLGFELRMISSIENVQDPQVWRDAIDEQVAAVLITHVHYNTNRLIPVREVARIARENDALSIVDVAQSSGAVPIDFKEWGADIVLGSSIKWLCGGAGAGFMWVSPEVMDRLNPIDVGWFSHADPFEFDIHNFQYSENSAKFWGGTPSVLPYVVATNSIKLLVQIGVHNIRNHNVELSKLLLDGIDSKRFVSPIDLTQKGGTTVLNFDNQTAAEEALRAAEVQFDVRAEGIRLSPHIYNTEQEISVVVDCLKTV